MSFISTGVEYGLHCLLYLADTSTGVRDASVRDLAEMQGVSVDYAAKLFTRLAKAGIVVSSEGIRGGFTLAKPARDISVQDVVAAIDGDKRLFDCREVRGQCAVFEGDAPAWATRGTCSIHAVMQVAEQAMRAELEKQSLADLAARAWSKAPASYGPKVIDWFADRAASRGGER
ncbi:MULTISPECIES: RrF2 family transcriptional regulator [Burkholderia]|uniref:Transcriptional regulator n=1 Tax=Burkholderia anthina TaxID=179879 RepID=A0A6P2G324_9BURK|nr:MULTISPECIES: Rrf2 family transcriptional regulator [Burkholderia]AXK61404.1 Rrf2 family transcriptional regulator [Burkholderia sp. IDO3]MBM2765386.1 Rrf2 family transcriptional regulator [Burkholderia anthina]MBY4866899.1 Rrf2 family transcriptional regulator [Burkholderia anthina]PCD62743.1 transcriptional regulator [Burkholderia sp. IDO3]PFH19460.1 BadM/Rrf2 family transcriptional regulator [Burkholderia sp. JKS000303]